MTNEEFMIEVKKAHLRSKAILLKKGKEYGGKDEDLEDRLDQFYKIAYLNDEPPTRSLWGMASKHVTSIADMVKCPTTYNVKQWREKVTDLRNYTYLLEALLLEDVYNE